MSVPTPQRGVAYLALLLAVAITGATLAAGATVWSQAQRREREKQLLWAGDQIRKAIIAYAQTGGNVANRYPAELKDLLLDPRAAAPRRHLRRIYDDPMTRSTDWGLVRNPQGRIVGVYSRATGAPVKTGKFPAAYASFEQAASYADWKFTALTDPRGVRVPGVQPGASAPQASERAASAPQAASPAASLPVRTIGRGTPTVPGAEAPTVPPAPAPSTDPAPEPPVDAPDSAPDTPATEADPASGRSD